MAAKKPSKPTLYLICGLPGSGKTMLARRLEAETKALRFSPDEWIVALYGADIAHDRDRLYAARDPVELLQADIAAQALARGVDVILENGFWGRGERDAWRARARDLGAAVELFYLDVPRDELWARLERRNANLPPATFHVEERELDEWIAMFQPPAADEGAKESF